MFQPAQLLHSLMNRIQPGGGILLEFTPGQVLKGTVQKLYPDNMALVQIGGAQVHARLETELQAGQKAWLQVQSGANPVTFKVLTSPDSPRQSQDASLEKLIRSLGIPESREAKTVVQAMIREGLPVTREAVEAYVRMAQANGKSDQLLQTFLFAQKRNLPLTQEVLMAMKAFFSSTLSDSMHLFLKEADQFLRSGGGQTGPLPQLLTSLKQQLLNLPLSMSQPAERQVGSARHQPTAASEPMTLTLTDAKGTASLRQGGTPGMQFPSAGGARIQAASGAPGQHPPFIAGGHQQEEQGNATGNQRNGIPSYPTGQSAGDFPDAPGAPQPVPSGLPRTMLSAQTGTAMLAKGHRGFEHQAEQSAGAGSRGESLANSNPGGAARNNALQGGQGVGVLSNAQQSGSHAPLPVSSGSAEGTDTVRQMPGQAFAAIRPDTGGIVSGNSSNLNLLRGESLPAGSEGETVWRRQGSDHAGSANPLQPAQTGDRKGGLIQQFLQKMGLMHERQIAALRFQEDSAAAARIETVKSILLHVTKAHAASLPSGLREAAEALLQHVTGQQLMLLQPPNQTLNQLVIQLPLRTEHGEETAFIQIESRKKDNGLLDPENCRLFFNLDLQRLGITMLDVNIVNRIVNVSVYNDLPWLEEEVQQMRTSFADQLSEAGYQLSGLRVQPLPDAPRQPQAAQRGQMPSPYKGVDIRV
ncbi:MAG: hypothetical protein H0Z34_01675 [Brevibacillus sp.]|nr:hypothetical protein [Brevibacillus sp.]